MGLFSLCHYPLNNPFPRHVVWHAPNNVGRIDSINVRECEYVNKGDFTFYWALRHKGWQFHTRHPSAEVSLPPDLHKDILYVACLPSRRFPLIQCLKGDAALLLKRARMGKSTARTELVNHKTGAKQQHRHCI